MEEKPCLPIPYSDATLEVVRSVRDIPPAHLLFKIQSFSLLSELLDKSKADNYESSDFEVGGYKWKLLLYPDGNKKQDVNGYISLYLTLSETENLPPGREVNVVFKFFVFDHIRDKYLTLEAGRVIRFHAWKTQRGFPRLLSLSTFNDPANGYLVDDCCVFGAEVFIIKSEGKGKSVSLSIFNQPGNGTFTWKLDNFSKLKDNSYLSDGFSVGGSQWKLELYPTGVSWVKGQSLSLFLCIQEYFSLRPGWKFHVEFILSIKDQVHGQHRERTLINLFCSSTKDWAGYANFISLSDLNDEKKGFIVNDTLIAEVKITFISIVKCFE